MKTTRTYKLNKPDYSDPIDIDELNENFDVIDFALEATQIKKTRVSNTISEKCILPYYRIRNNNDFDVTVTDRNFSVDYVIEAGKSKRFDVDGTNTDMNFYVQGLHDVEFEWFVFVKDAIEEGGGGGTGGTKNYNDLTNKPKINGAELSGNVALATLGIKGAAAKDVDTTGTAVTSTSTNVPTSAAVVAYVTSKIGELPKPMQIKGTLGTASGATATLPTAAEANTGWLYIVVTDGTYASQAAVIGDMFVSNGSKWLYVPSGNELFDGRNIILTEYAKGSAKPSSITILATDSVNEALKKIEWALDDKVNKTTTINGKALSSNVTLSGNDEKLNATSYSKDTEAKEITKDTKIDEAVAQLEYRVDKKINKTEVIATDETEMSTRTVPSGCTAAMVAKIKGKTVKNLFGGYTDMSSYTNVSEKYNGHDCIQATVAWSGARDTNLTLVTGKKYCIRAMVKVSVANTNVQLYGGSSTIKMFTIPSANTWTLLEYIGGVTSSSTTNIRFEATTAVTTTISEFVVAESETSVPYIPPATLASAPVESVVSRSKNLWDEQWMLGEFDDSGNAASSSIKIRSSNFTAVSASTEYKASNKGVMYICFYNSSKTFVGSANLTADKHTFTTSSTTAFIRFNMSSDYGTTYKKDLVINKATDFFETTVLVPNEVRNCVGYGSAISSTIYNIADFENGAHTSVCNEIDLGNLDWKYDTTPDKVWFYADVSGMAPVYNTVVSNALCGKYDAVSRNDLPASNSKFACTPNATLLIKDSSRGTDPAAFKTYIKGTRFVYQLATPVVTPIPMIRPVSTEPGGTVTLQNPHDIDVPNVVKYKKEV